MSKRNEIIDGARSATARGGLVYTEVLGWIDPGHARGDDIRILMAKFKQGEAASTLYDWSSGNVAIASMDGSFIQSGKQKDLII